MRRRGRTGSPKVSEYEVLEYGIFKRKRSAEDDLFV